MKKTSLILLFFLSCFHLSGQSEKEIVQSTVNKDDIKGHIYFLADDLLKGRETGTSENKIAASYLANQLRSYGVKPNPQTGNYYQEVPLEKTSKQANNVSIEINGVTLKNGISLGKEAAIYEGNFIYLNYGDASDFKENNIKGKVVLVNAGNSSSQDLRSAFRSRRNKAALAQEGGAVGLIEFVDVNEENWYYADHNFNGDRLSLSPEMELAVTIPFVHIWIHDEGKQQIDKLKASKKIKGNMKVLPAVISGITSQNVIGMVEGSDPILKNEFIIYSAHYDHVGIGHADKTGDTIYNGARDNAIGTTTVLSFAENMAKHPTKRSALFILFTGEEKGLLGSEYYVENPVLPLNQMVYCFNSDNGGYNDTSLATIVGLERTTASQDIKNAALAFGLTAIEDPSPEEGLFDRSDNVHFAKKGIPAPTFSLGFTAFNGDVTKYYHQPSDEADSLDYEYLEKFFSAYVLAGRNIGNNPQTPFWIAGDKYEDQGKKLYKK